jgi:hypothetical protein
MKRRHSRGAAISFSANRVDGRGEAVMCLHGRRAGAKLTAYSRRIV